MLSKLAQFTDIRLALVVGGLSLQSQASALRSNPEIVVATPVTASSSSGLELRRRAAQASRIHRLKRHTAIAGCEA